MKYRLMDVLACPYDKTFPLRLIVLRRREVNRPYTWPRKPFCEEYCAYRDLMVRQHPKPEELPCEECHRWEIDVAVIYCPTCGRWFPVDEGIPRMLPDELRDRKWDVEFLRRVREDLEKVVPDLAGKILNEGKPHNMATPV